tara:strand:- start:31 stop:261 length:231 start_codon:yes stop_codon:yes gene_type:complete
MDHFGTRFEQKGGEMYINLDENQLQTGGKKIKRNIKNLSPTSENWKKKYLEIQMENENLKDENKKLKKKLKQLESK